MLAGLGVTTLRRAVLVMEEVLAAIQISVSLAEISGGLELGLTVPKEAHALAVCEQ